MPLTKAANTLTNFGGTASLTPLLGAFIADAFAGRFWTITVASIIYQMVEIAPPNPLIFILFFLLITNFIFTVKKIFKVKGAMLKFMCPAHSKKLNVCPPASSSAGRT